MLGWLPTDADAVPLDEVSAEPCLRIGTPQLDFGLVAHEAQAAVAFTLENTCGADRHLDGLRIPVGQGLCVAHPDIPCAAAVGGPPTAWLEHAFDTPLVVPSHGALTLEATFTARVGELVEGFLLLETDDVVAGPTLALAFKANEHLPCFVLSAQGLSFVGKADAVTFGGKVVGVTATRDLILDACEGRQVQVEAVTLTGDPQFAITPSAPLPLRVSHGYPLTLTLSYLPEAVSSTADDGTPTYDTADIAIHTNAYEPVRTVPVRGFGVSEPCAEALIYGSLGGEPLFTDQVPPGTVVQFHGDASAPAWGEIASYRWSVQDPHGLSWTLPDASAQALALELVGTYSLALEVQDSAGLDSCVPAYYEVTVVPDSPLLVELTWTTDGDPDPLDEGPDAGADLDVHLRHPFATGLDVDGDDTLDGWFDVPFDVFWANPEPLWPDAAEGAVAGPVLDRDDTDGYGPERLYAQSLPVSGTYHLGVHGWDDHGYGASAARLRVWIDGVLMADEEYGDLLTGDLWAAMALQWPEGVLVPLTGPDKEPWVLTVAPESLQIFATGPK